MATTAASLPQPELAQLLRAISPRGVAGEAPNPSPNVNGRHGSWSAPDPATQAVHPTPTPVATVPVPTAVYRPLAVGLPPPQPEVTAVTTEELIATAPAPLTDEALALIERRRAERYARQTPHHR